MSFGETMQHSLQSNIHHRLLCFLMGCLAGCILFILIYGFRILIPTNDAWLINSTQEEGLWDLSQHYYGWCFYRRSAWHFPIGLMDGIYCKPVSIVYTDSIPLFALIFKLLSPLLPDTFQYFGLFGLLCYGLAGGFGALVAARFTDSIFCCILSGFLFAISPCMLKRMFYHTALSAHFLILAAFVLWMYRDIAFARRRKLYNVLWGILSACATLINPYFTPMIIGIQLCSLLQELIASRHFLRILPTFLASILSVIGSGWIIGMFSGSVEAAATGLEQLSFNPLQFINPANYLLDIEGPLQFKWSTVNYSLILPELPSVSPWQEEGFAYLGLGIITLLIVSIVLIVITLVHHCHIIRGHRRRISVIISVLLCAVIFLVLSLSPTWTFGPVTIGTIAWPEKIYHLLSIFRSTGRLIWPVYYLLMITAVSIPAKVLSNTGTRQKSFFTIVLAACVLIQSLDLIPALAYKYSAYHQVFSEHSADMPSAVWNSLAKDSSQVIFCPDTSDYVTLDPALSCRFEHLALQYDLSLSITYMSRDVSSGANRYASDALDRRKGGTRDSNIIYIFSPKSPLPDSSSLGLKIYEIDGYLVGSERDLHKYPDVNTISRVSD